MASRSKRDMRTLAGFVTGLLVGAAAMAVGAQANRLDGNSGVNHVGISVESMDDAIAYYTEMFGFGEAAVLRDDAGQPTLAFIQVSRNTFIELGRASDARPAGLTHFGLEVDDLEAATAELRRRGVEIGDPRVGPHDLIHHEHDRRDGRQDGAVRDRAGLDAREGNRQLEVARRVLSARPTRVVW